MQIREEYVQIRRILYNILYNVLYTIYYTQYNIQYTISYTIYIQNNCANNSADMSVFLQRYGSGEEAVFESRGFCAQGSVAPARGEEGEQAVSRVSGV